MPEDKNGSIAYAKEKVELDGWVYFIDYYGNGIFKSRPDGSNMIRILSDNTNCKCYNLKIDNENLISYYVDTAQYSVFDEDHYEYNRYKDIITYAIDIDKNESVEVKRSQGYLGTSN